MRTTNHFVRALALLLSIGLLGAILNPAAIESLKAMAQSMTLASGDQLTVDCASRFSITRPNRNKAILKCQDGTVTPTTTTPVAATTTPVAANPTPTMDHDHGGGAALGICGEPMDAWHPAVVNGCATAHEHGDAPPAWIAAAGYQVSFHGHFNTSPLENSAKHAAMKGFSTTFNNVEIYLRIHAASNPLDRSARYHSYELWAHDPSGGVSHWQGWYNVGDPVADRIVRRKGTEPGQRPIMLVVDQTSWDQGIRCEQWYSAPGEPAWGWDFGWTICNTSTLFQPGENATATDLSTWKPAPDGSTGTVRRLEAAWYTSRQHPTGAFYATQFGEIVAGPNDARCTATTTKFGTSYQNVCLEQYIAPTMSDVKFPGNAVQKQFDAPLVKLPN